MPFIHESVGDFLVKEKGLQDLWPELGFEFEGSSHERLRRCCTTYLHLPELQEILDGSEDGDERDALAEKYPFLVYASQHVLHHANIAAPVIPLFDFLSEFFASGGIRVMNLFEGRQNRRYSAHATPLYVLADKGLGNLIRTQMKRESAAHAPRERYEYPLFAAFANGHKGAVAALLGLPSAICDGVDITEDLKYRRYKGRTPLSWAAQEGRLSLAKALAQGGADTNESDRQGYAPLVRASENGHEAVARLLIDKGPDVNAQNTSGWTALVLASRNGHEAVARLLRCLTRRAA